MDQKAHVFLINNNFSQTKSPVHKYLTQGSLSAVKHSVTQTMSPKYGIFCQDHVLSASDLLSFPDIHLSDLMYEKIRSHGDKTLFIEGKTGHKYSAKEMCHMSEKMSRRLLQLGLNQEDIVFCVSPDSVTYAAAIIAIHFAGLVYSGCYWTVPKREIVFQVEKVAAKVILCSEQNLAAVCEAADESSSVQYVVCLHSVPKGSTTSAGKMIISIVDFLKESHVEDETTAIPVGIKKSPTTAVCCVMFSSGSTGMPKGVIVTHANAMAQCYSQMRDLEPENYIEAGTVGFAHTVGLTLIRLVVLTGITVVVQDNFLIQNFLETVEKYRCTNAWLSPSELTQLVKSPLLSKYDVSSLREVKVGGATIPDPVIKAFYHRTGGQSKITGVYGLTECGDLTHVPKDVTDSKTVGSLLPGHELKVVDNETTDGTALPPFKVGEICVRGPQLSPGYLTSPEANYDNFTADAWFKSGDMGFIADNGLVYVIGRYKEVIKGDGEQVAPAELESLILSHESVAEAAVIGIPDEDHCEVPKAFVVLRESGHNASVKEILEFVNSQVADYKRIRGGMEVVTSLPKISIGKIDRLALKKRPRSPNDSTRV